MDADQTHSSAVNRRVNIIAGLMSEPITTRTVHRPAQRTKKTLTADICVVGAGISGVSAALEGARLGLRVVIVDAAPSLGGQAIGSIIGTIIGLYTHGPKPYQITHGIADELIEDLTKEGSLNRRVSMTGTVTFQYDEVRLGRWIERKIEEAGIQALLGAVLTGVVVEGRRIAGLELATRFGAARVEAQGYVDASGDATVTYEAGFDVREPVAPVYGSLNFLIEGYDTVAVKDLVVAEVHERLAKKGSEYGLVRHDGFLMHFPGKDFMLANVTHLETALDPLATASMVSEGRRQADNVIRFLRAEFPRIFERARIRTYGNPGLRQTRWIVGSRQLTLDDIRKGERPPDAVARCAWWVELHNAKDLVHWERFEPDHVYYIPLSCMMPKDADNIVAAGRCVDADVRALSAIRVMGPCIAMGAAATHSLDLAGSGSVHQVDLARLQQRLHDNLERTD
jgi:FAD dependent oxidoreductase